MQHVSFFGDASIPQHHGDSIEPNRPLALAIVHQFRVNMTRP
jgi:hypothetical protein